MSTVAGVKLQPKSKLKKYIENQRLLEKTPIDLKHNMFNVISVDDIRNLVKYQQNTSTTFMQKSYIV